MDAIFELINTDMFLLVMFCLIILFIIITFILIAKLNRIKKNYNNFMKKIGNGTNIQEDLETFMHKVDRVEKQNLEIVEYCKNLDKDLEGCIQKIGIVRYNAFKDTGSDLSFALAMLDENNNGVVLNGIYSREMSNIYAKPVQNGISNYTISEEEKMAIEKAVNSKKIYKIK